MDNLRPFYPCQTVSGETYVVDARSNRVVRNVAMSFDVGQRWAEAKRIANRMNNERVIAVYARRRAVVQWIAVCVIIGGVLALLTWLT